MIAQMIIARENGWHIKVTKENMPSGTAPYPTNEKYISSIFLQTLFEVIAEYNASLDTEFEPRVDLDVSDGLRLGCESVLKSNLDMFSYFRRHFASARTILHAKAKEAGYELPFDPSKTILVHLRLGDVRNKQDYDGRLCAEYVINKLNNGQVFREGEIAQPYNHQCGIPQERLQGVINHACEKNPDMKVILVTAPGEDLSSWPYEHISSRDESFDLYLLCCSEVVIASRSTFSLAAAFFGEQKSVYIPVWGHTACMGLGTRYQPSIEHFKFFF
jgi:hypothetical protein